MTNQKIAHYYIIIFTFLLAILKEKNIQQNNFIIDIIHNTKCSLLILVCITIFNN